MCDSILFVPNLGKARSKNHPMWGADIFAEAFVKHSKHYISIEYNLDNMGDYDLVWIHNIAILLSGVRGRVGLALSLLGKHPPIIGGVRGHVGYKRSKHYLKGFDAIHAGSDRLIELVKTRTKNVVVLSSGYDPDLFAYCPPPQEFCIGWAGDTKKKMKNLDIVHNLRVPTRWATKENYIPYPQMPARFYHKINALVHPSSHEGSSRVIMEAAACGLPIICTDVGHSNTIVSPEWMITLDDPVPQIKSKLKLLKENPVLARQVGLDNQANVTQYTWERVIDRADVLIDQVLQ